MVRLTLHYYLIIYFQIPINENMHMAITCNVTNHKRLLLRAWCPPSWRQWLSCPTPWRAGRISPENKNRLNFAWIISFPGFIHERTQSWPAPPDIIPRGLFHFRVLFMNGCSPDLRRQTKFRVDYSISGFIHERMQSWPAPPDSLPGCCRWCCSRSPRLDWVRTLIRFP